jgi:uncharacterized protein (TIGR02246 family)
MENEISALYHALLDAWNKRSAHDYAALIAENGSVVGFDGSQMNGRAEIENEISQIFRDHETAKYIAKVREIRSLSPDVAILRAVCGMVPPGKTDLNPAVNSIQSLVAQKQADQWQIVLFQNTPAQFHGRPELSDALTAELRALL